MADLESPEDLRDYALRALGAPVINIEIDDTQIWDRIDDTIEKFIEKHYNGVTEVFKLHRITESDVSKGYIQPDKSIVSIVEIYKSDIEAENSAEAFERLNFRIAQTDVLDKLLSSGLSEYYLKRQHLNTFLDIFSPSRVFQFNPIRNYLNVSKELIVGDFVIYHGYEALNPEKDSNVYDDRWVKKYAIQMIKQQWGSNVKKYDGIQLPGGLTMNGQQIYDEASAALEKLDDEFSLKYEYPVDFMMGPSFI